MSINFGVGTLKVLDNLGIDVVAGDLSASASTMTAGADRTAMIDGITAIWSAQVVSVTALLTTSLGATGSGLLYYIHLGSNLTTGIVALATAADPINTAYNSISTAIAPLFKFDFGNGANNVSGIVLVSGGSATKTIGKVQNVSINASYESAMMRGGADVYPVDTQFFDGAVEGSWEFSDVTAQQNMFFGGIYTSAGSASGTWTISGTSKPNSVSLVFVNVTEGITSTYRILKAYTTEQTNDFSRTDFMSPSFSFISQSNVKGNVMTVEG